MTCPEHSVDSECQPIHRVVNHFLHDFLGGLTSVIMQIEAVRDGMFGEVSVTQKERLGRAVRDCERMISLIQDYRDATQMLEGQFSPELEVLDVSELQDSLRDRLAEIEARRGLATVLFVQDGVTRVRAGASMVRRVVFRLLEAMSACTRRGGVLNVDLRVTNRMLEMRVCAEGVEFSQTELDTVFDEMSQATHGIQPGRGYAMVFCKAAARSIGGDIRLLSWPGRGTRAELFLPVEPF